jgi:hypothetical protein
MPSRNGGDGVSLLANDGVAASHNDYEMKEFRDLSGSIDILWQLKQGAPRPETVVEVHEASVDFMTDFFDQVS